MEFQARRDYVAVARSVGAALVRRPSVGLRGSRRTGRVVVGAVVGAGCVGLTMVLFLPLVALRRMFPRRDVSLILGETPQRWVLSGSTQAREEER